MPSQLLDTLPVPLVFVAFAIVTLVCYEVGFRLGRWWQVRTPGEQEGPTGMLVGSILALLAFLLAVTMGMAGYTEVVGAASGASEIETMLQMLWLRFDAVRRDEDLFKSFIGKQVEAARNRDGQPAARFGETVTATGLDKAAVTVEILGATKGPKIVIQKYKNKTGYKKRQGHRQKYTQVKVTDISL